MASPGTLSKVPFSELAGIGFYVLGTQDNIRESCVEVQHQDLFRGTLPLPQGLYDAHLGTTDREWSCETCYNSKRLCPGHPGSYRLNIPVLSPLFIKDIIKWLKVICFNCGKPIINPENIKAVKKRILGECVKLTRVTNKNIICPYCSKLHPHIIKDPSDPITIYMEFYEPKTVLNDNKLVLLARVQLYPHQIESIFNKITAETVESLGKPLESHPSKFMINVLRVPPNSIRPDVKRINIGRSNSNDLTILLQTIMRFNIQLPTTLPPIIDKDLDIKIHNLCLAVFELIKGSSSTAKRGIVSVTKKPLVSITKRLPKKTGRIRRNLMGRRSEHMARSFITCDIFLKTSEVGIPLSIARDIQRPMIVREFNYKEAMIYFMNGTKRYPGCSKIKRGATGAIHWRDGIKENFTLEIGDTIYRDTIDGDIIDLNRQPSLEPSSITAMKAVIMPHKQTIRININSCGLFNADFDGDAMNVEFPQSSRTANEIQELSSVKEFAVSYKDGKPVIGECQDALVGLASLTANVTKVDKFHAMALFGQTNVYHDFSGYDPHKLIPGRDIISIYLKDTKNLINVSAVPGIYKEQHAQYRVYDPMDIKVEIDRGELKSGVLDKVTTGERSMGSIFHIINNQYGAESALDALFYMQQIAITFLFSKGFTISLRDLVLKEDAIKNIHRVESELIAESHHITENLNQGKIIAPIGSTLEQYYEAQQVNALNHGDEFWEYVLGSIDPEQNGLYRSIMIGARGKLFNLKNTLCAIGQLEINGERIVENFAGRTLPYFTKYDPDPKSRGYINDSYITGIITSALFFHAEEARYTIISRALSTAVAGSHNRMSVKNLEGITVDNQRKAVNTNKIVQLIYGADGADPRFIERVKFPTMRADIDNETFAKLFKVDLNISEDENEKGGKSGKGEKSRKGGKGEKKGKDKKDEDEKEKEKHKVEKEDKDLEELIEEEFDQLKKDREFYIHLFRRLEFLNSIPYSDSLPMPVNISRIIEDTIYNLGLRNNKSNLDIKDTIIKVKKLCTEIPYCLMNSIQKQRGSEIPLHMKTACTLLCVLIRSYLNVATLIRKGVTTEALEVIMDQIVLYYTRSLIDYGKAIGIITSQSISEPITQIVLDSHHTSGAGSTKKKGMFRIREILSARPTSGMKSSSMNIYVLPQYHKDKIKVQEIASYIEMLKLNIFVNSWQIFFERYGEPVHPNYVQEKAFIAEFDKHHGKVPTNLTYWCIRIVLDKSKLIEKRIKIDTIYHKLRTDFPYIYIIYSTENSDDTILRIYVRNTFSKKEVILLQQIVELTESIMNTVVRGIEGINATYIKESDMKIKQEDGKMASEKIYYIFTDGTNLKRVLEVPYIDPDLVQTDSIIETYEVFGIIAARNKIITELRAQVSESSYRHYTIYADEMTHSGIVTSIDRYGSANRNNSVLLRISDASPISVIEEAATNAATDDLSGVSPAIMVGKNPYIGDLYNTFKIDEKLIKKNTSNLEDIISAL